MMLRLLNVLLIIGAALLAGLIARKLTGKRFIGLLIFAIILACFSYLHFIQGKNFVPLVIRLLNAVAIAIKNFASLLLELLT